MKKRNVLKTGMVVLILAVLISSSSAVPLSNIEAGDNTVQVKQNIEKQLLTNQNRDSKSQGNPNPLGFCFIRVYAYSVIPGPLTVPAGFVKINVYDTESGDHLVATGYTRLFSGVKIFFGLSLGHTYKIIDEEGWADEPVVITLNSFWNSVGLCVYNYHDP